MPAVVVRFVPAWAGSDAVSFGQRVTLMKRRPLIVHGFWALALAGVLVWSRSADAGLRYVRVEGLRWDEERQRCIRVVIRVDDPQLLAQVQPWREAVRREACEDSFRRLVPWFQRRQYCENALRQPMERLTLVYRDGHREVEQVNIYKTPFGDCWQKAQRSGPEVAQ
jgi:hypothetical protein